MKHKIVYVITTICIFLWGFLNFFVVAQTEWVNEQTPNQQNTEQQDQKFLTLLSKTSQILYAFTWPLLVIAWKFMDNSIVYGEFIGMDKTLWGVWNTIRTFANFLIGFIFIFSIFAYFFEIKKDKLDPRKLMPKMVFATILVNGSWFIIWALIDLSTILTYGVWALPLKIATINSSDSNWLDFAIPTINIKISPTNTNQLFDVKLCWKYPPCVVDKDKKVINKNADGCFDLWTEDKKIVYKIFHNGEQIWPNKWEILDDDGCIIKWKTLVEKMKDLTGPFIAIFSSLMNSSQVWLVETSIKPTTASSIVMLKALFLIAFLVPLLTLCIILFVRVVILWLVIVLSPLLFLFSSLGFKELLQDKKSVSSVITLIFLPAIATFALSISLIFMNALHKSQIQTPWNNSPKLLSQFNIKQEGDKLFFDVNWDGKYDDNDVNFELENNTQALTALLKDIWNWFWRIIWNLFGIGFMWVVVFSALKTSKITASIADRIQKFTEAGVKAAPIIPVFKWQSLSSLKNVGGYIKQLPIRKQGEQYREKLAPLMWEFQRELTWVEKEALSWATSHLKSVPKNITIKPLNSIPKDVDIDKKNIQPSTPISKLKPETIRKIADKMNVSPETIRSVLWTEWKLAQLQKDETVEEIKKEEYKKQILSFLKDKLLWNQISLIQLFEYNKKNIDDFSEMYRLAWIEETINFEYLKSEDEKKKFIKVLLTDKVLSAEFKDQKEDVFKLLSSDLEDNTIPPHERVELEKIYKEVEKEIEWELEEKK